MSGHSSHRELWVEFLLFETPNLEGKLSLDVAPKEFCYLGSARSARRKSCFVYSRSEYLSEVKEGARWTTVWILPRYFNK